MPVHIPSWQVRWMGPISLMPGSQVDMPIAPMRCSFSGADGMYVIVPLATAKFRQTPIMKDDAHICLNTKRYRTSAYVVDRAEKAHTSLT